MVPTLFIWIPEKFIMLFTANALHLIATLRIKMTFLFFFSYFRIMWFIDYQDVWINCKIFTLTQIWVRVCQIIQPWPGDFELWLMKDLRNSYKIFLSADKNESKSSTISIWTLNIKAFYLSDLMMWRFDW